MVRIAAAALFALLLAGTGAAAGPLAPSVCTRAIAQAETERAIPRGLLMAIGFGESGRNVEGRSTVWPWTINVEGSGYFLPGKQQAIAFVRDRLSEGKRSIDVGCMQINLRWHPDAFASLEEAFDPQANARYAARFLTALRQEVPTPGLDGWLEAVGRYHSATAVFAERYRNHVSGHWARVRAPEMLMALAGPGDAISAQAAEATAGDATYRTTDGRGERETMPVIPASFGGIAIVGLPRFGTVPPPTAGATLGGSAPLPPPDPARALLTTQPGGGERSARRRPAYGGPAVSFSERIGRSGDHAPQGMRIEDYQR